MTKATTQARIEALLEDIYADRHDDSVPAEVKAWVDAQLRENSQEIQRVTGGNSYQNYVLTYITREKTKFQYPADSRRNTYGERRGRPLCTCRQDCAIKAADEPVEFRKHQDLNAAIRAYKRRHPGHPIVLDDARRQWDEHTSNVEHLLNALLRALTNKYIPEPGEMDAELLNPSVRHPDDLEPGRGPGGRDGTNHHDEGDGADGGSVDEKVREVAASAGDD